MGSVHPFRCRQIQHNCVVCRLSYLELADVLLRQHILVSFKAPGLQDLIKELKFNLASYKMPSEIIFLDKIPLIGVGKVDKVKLKELYKSMFS